MNVSPIESAKSTLLAFPRVGIERLLEGDGDLYALIEQEYDRQKHSLSLVASCSTVDPAVAICEGTPLVNVTAEGYPRMRFHAGCRFIDEIEQLAIDRAKRAFGATHANVQAHSASVANQVALFGLMKPGETFLGMRLDQGGHLSHGAKVSFSGQVFNAVGYGVDEAGFLDYEEVDRLAQLHRPKVIICGATAYPRAIDFAKFRKIADRAEAYLVADISHIAGLVVAGLHANPVDHAHITTTCTHKQLFGPRGGLILLGKDADARGPDGKRTMREIVQSGIFPLLQGAPFPQTIAAKACALGRVLRPEFKEVARRIKANAAALAQALGRQEYALTTGGSDNHIVVMDVSSRNMSGLVAERALEECDIIVNRNKIPGDRRAARVASGVRLGTNNVAFRGMSGPEMNASAGLIAQVLRSIQVKGDAEYTLQESVVKSVRASVRELCMRFEIPSYP